MSASRPGATPARWVVVCDAYRTAPVSSKAAAERLLVGIIKAGHCRQAHRVEATR